LSKLNSQYLTPLDTQKRNAPLNPFYSYSPELYLLPPRAILARGLYEGVCALLRKENPELENLLGEALEQMTADAIEQFGRRPVIVRQKYRVPGKRKRDAPFEIDVIDLTDRHVFILECKKKALTNSARGGNTLAAALDFARGFLYPLVQTNRHESQLRNSEGLTLLNGETFKLDGRNLQRIAVTMTDHGSMQDRAFLRGMIATLWNSNLKSVDPASEKSANEINGYVLALTTGITELARQAGESLDDYVRGYVGGCWFLGIDQLWYLCSKASDLWSAISPMGGLTYGTGDIMTELAYSDRAGILGSLRDAIASSKFPASEYGKAPDSEP
jgi:Nuclease-related domain